MTVSLAVREIRLGTGNGGPGNRVALVDDEDYVLISQYAWHAHTVRGVTYAVRRPEVRGVKHVQYMHALITGWPLVDHKDHDGLNNQRSNLREATHAENMHNSLKRDSVTSRFKGVGWHSKDRKWRVRIQINGRRRQFGEFAVEEEAAHAYDRAAREAFGEFAALNFPDEVLP
jgi:hypothetical protein